LRAPNPPRACSSFGCEFHSMRPFRCKTAYFRVRQGMGMKNREHVVHQCGVIGEPSRGSRVVVGARAPPFEVVGSRRFGHRVAGKSCNPTLERARPRSARDLPGFVGSFGTIISVDSSANTPRGGTGACPGGTPIFHLFGPVRGPPSAPKSTCFCEKRCSESPKKSGVHLGVPIALI
jgi:hypothetical protein